MPRCDPDYKHAVFALYRYEPSKPAATIFTILFALTTILHLLQMIRTRAWYLTALVIGGLGEPIASDPRHAANTFIQLRPLAT